MPRTCWKCDGSGERPYGRCPACSGRGEVRTRDEDRHALRDAMKPPKRNRKHKSK